MILLIFDDFPGIFMVLKVYIVTSNAVAAGTTGVGPLDHSCPPDPFPDCLVLKNPLFQLNSTKILAWSGLS